MAIKDILLLGNPKLHEVSEPIEKHELPALLPYIELMWESIVDIKRTYGFGRGIAAPQIGLQKRIICLNIDKPLALINPEISNCSNEFFELWDDCMSFPNLLVKVKRHKSLTLNFRDLNWEKHTWHLKDDLAELIQHDHDHLDGILATQRAIDDRSFKMVN